MGVDKHQLLFGKVMHSRLFPKSNKFSYGIYYLSISLSKLSEIPIAYNKFGLLSFYDKDHGKCDGSDLQEWLDDIKEQYNLSVANGETTLMCMPRVIGYVFNPVSFWLCHDKEGQLRAVLCEVHNTFGEKHTYVCAHEDQRPIQPEDTLTGQKIFHVSPMLEREGHYEFRFLYSEKSFAAWIDFYDIENNKKLVTSLIGRLDEMNSKSLSKAFWVYPLITFKAITLIHWQALKLLVKGIKYISKPKQKEQRVSGTENLTQM